MPPPGDARRPATGHLAIKSPSDRHSRTNQATSLVTGIEPKKEGPLVTGIEPSAAGQSAGDADVPRQRGAARYGRESFRRYVAGAAAAGEWLVWAEFAERAWRDLTRWSQYTRALANATDHAKFGEARQRAERELKDLGLDWQGGISPPGQFFTSMVNGMDWPGKAAFADQFATQLASESEALETYQARAKANEEYRAVFAERMAHARAQNPWTVLSKTVVQDSVGAWRKAREHVLGELETLGLAATVMCTDGPVALEEHEADLAGLVWFQGSDCPSRGAAEDSDYSERMAQTHGLIAHGGLPTTLRGFCGQFAEYRRPSWMDHACTWLDCHGEPVLSVEPYQFDPAEVVTDLDELPLCLDGPYPGIWDDRTTLLMFRWNSEAAVLPAEATKEWELRA